ncbi:MAG: hypothetical protein EZS28_015688 [Streblomastix strix]|uniref:Uncharacterized protein n=1 Tax=Streblomastix strix TaxID=222440 RepID=A0A5J4W2M4_9EUKA|nr:MAG: hypothetical protein EZS28_015688 [Streblomastix strix]
MLPNTYREHKQLQRVMLRKSSRRISPICCLEIHQLDQGRDQTKKYLQRTSFAIRKFTMRLMSNLNENYTFEQNKETQIAFTQQPDGGSNDIPLQSSCEFSQLTLEQRNRIAHVGSIGHCKKRHSEQKCDRNYKFTVQNPATWKGKSKNQKISSVTSISNLETGNETNSELERRPGP